MSRHCANRVFVTGGSSILQSPKYWGRTTRCQSAVRFRGCCVRANFWKSDHHLPVKVAPSEILEVMQASDVFSSIRRWSRLQLVTMTGSMLSRRALAC
nr:unnamed protein product [Digitaria exilis]